MARAPLLGPVEASEYLTACLELNERGPGPLPTGPRAEQLPVGAMSRARAVPCPASMSRTGRLSTRLEKQTQKLTMPALNNELLPPSGRGPTPKCLSELTHHSPPPEGGGNNCSICSIQAVTWMDRTWAGSSILLLIDQQLHVSNPTKPGGCCGVDTHCREQTQLGP